MKRMVKVHAVSRDTRESSVESSISMAMPANGNYAPPQQKGSSRRGSVISREWNSIFPSQSDESKNIRQEIMARSSKKSALDLIKLLGIILPQILALISVSVLLLTESVEVMRHSGDLKQHVLWMEPIRFLITQMQREREMTCVLISTDR